MEAHDAHIVEIATEVPLGKPNQVGIKGCGGAPCGFSDSTNGAVDAKERSASMRKLWIAVVLCIVFMTVEVIGGIKANSLAIMTDAAHLLSDVAAFGISLFSLWAAGWEATPRQSYGFFRIEILGTLVSIQLIWLLTGILVYEAIERMINDSGHVEGFLMFIVAAFGLVVNVIMALLLGHDHGHGGHSHDHGHGHGDAHSHVHGPSVNMHRHLSQSKHEDKHHHRKPVGDERERKQHDNEVGHNHSEHDHEHGEDKDQREHHKHEGVQSEHHHKHGAGSAAVAPDNDNLKQPLLSHLDDGCCTDESQKSTVKSEPKQKNINVQGAYLHVLGDSIQSIGVMVGGALIWWKPEWRIIDLICTLFFSVIVLATTISMLRSILEVLMESTPREIDARRLEQGLCEMGEVEAVHELHIWAITVGKILLACHVKIKPDADADLVLDKVISYIQREYNISHVTIQIER